LIGNGFTLPPHQMPQFPLLHHLAPPAWNEQETLSAVNEAAQSLGRPTLVRLPQLFWGDACLVHTFPLLDPYHTQRTEPVDGPIFAEPPVAARAGGQSIFAYLSHAKPYPAVFEALKPHAARLHAYAPALAESQRGELRRLGARVDEEPLPLTEVLAQSRLVVHHGGNGVASEALASGVPQLVLSTQVEQNLTGETLQQRGVAGLIRMYDPNAKLTPQLIEDLATDHGLAARAAELGEQCRAYACSHNALQKIERVCREFLG
jgi:UDP:flavonoid glycosyltransferase YjiC (YdhE family)